jgi:glutamate-1-semialdehyde aminotransferase
MSTDTPDPDRMVRTTIHLPFSLLASVRTIAQRRGVSPAAVIRAAVDAVVSNHRPPPSGGFLGEAGGSGGWA